MVERFGNVRRVEMPRIDVPGPSRSSGSGQPAGFCFAFSCRSWVRRSQPFNSGVVSFVPFTPIILLLVTFKLFYHSFHDPTHKYNNGTIKVITMWDPKSRRRNWPKPSLLVFILPFFLGFGDEERANFKNILIQNLLLGAKTLASIAEENGAELLTDKKLVKVRLRKPNSDSIVLQLLFVLHYSDIQFHITVILDCKVL